MSDPEPTILPTPTPEPVRATPPPAAPRTRGNAGAALALLVAALAAAAGGWALWRSFVFERDHGERLVDIARNTRTQSDALSTLTQEISRLVERNAALERRIADAETVNRSLREEVLGLGERARLVEDAVASLAQARLEGVAALRLNEAELLLRLGTARLQLFRDTAGASAAYRLADAQLATLDDATLAGVRQTIAAEIAELDAHAGVPLEATLAELDAVATALATLPTRVVVVEAPPPAADEGYTDKLARALGSLVRIRRVEDAAEGALAPLTGDAARAAVDLELALAKSALVAHDDGRYARALARARASLVRSFDDSAPEVQAALARLDNASLAGSGAALPASGRALEQLQNLRATRAVAASPAPAPSASSAPPPEAAPAEPPAAPPTETEAPSPEAT